MNLRRSVRAVLLGVLLLSTCGALPCRAQGRLLEFDHSHETLYLESNQTVTTWEDGPVRVFIADAGAVIRQGESRLSAPRMVVWFDREASARAGVRAARVRVYAEGVENLQGRGVPVRLVERRSVREAGAVSMHFSSTLAFVWDCPLNRREAPVPSPLLTRAEDMTAEAQGEFLWTDYLPPTAEERLHLIAQNLNAEYSEVEFAEGRMVGVYMGDVRGTYANMDIRADAAVAWYSSSQRMWELYAEGNVRIARAAAPAEQSPLRAGAEAGVTDVLDFLHADRLYINPETARGLATTPHVRVRDPYAPVENVYVVRGQEAFIVDSQTLVITKASLSQCEFARPHYHFESRRAQVVRHGPNTVLNAWDVRLKAGRDDRTLLWVPFLGTNLSNRAFLLADYALGVSSKFGAFMQTTWLPMDLMAAPPDWLEEWTVNLDYYGARGPAVGTQIEYGFGSGRYPTHDGRIDAYFVHDRASRDDNDVPVPQRNRGRFHWEHRSQLSPFWRVDAEYYRLSDANFLNEYFEDDFENRKPPESYLLARYLRDSTYLALLYKAQVNDFLTQIEERPSADLQVLGLSLGRLVYDGSLTAGLYDLEFSDLIAPAPNDPPAVTRFHTDHRLSLPFMAGIVRVNPFVRALATTVSRSADDGTGFQGRVSRAGVGAGITASTTFSRAYDLTSERFNLNRLRHVVVEALSVSGDGSADFIQMDEIDTIDNMVQATVGVRQRLQTKRLVDEQWQSIDWAKLDVALVARSSDSVNTDLDEGYISADFRMQLTDHLSLHSRDNRISLGDLPSVYNMGLAAEYMPRWALSIDYDRISDVCSTVTLTLSRELSDRYRLLLFEQYEFDSRGTGDRANLGTTVILRRVLHKWVLDLGLHVERANDEVAFIFGFGPAGWGVYTDPRRAGRR